MKIGVDISRNHLTIGLIEGDLNEIKAKAICRKRISNDSDSLFLNLLTDSIREIVFLNDISEISKIGISIHGPFDYKNGTLVVNSQSGDTGFKLKDNLSKSLSIDKRNISFYNDAVCFLKAEILKERNLINTDVIGLKIGTGLGTAYCQNGVFKDANLWKAPFKEGIVEDYISEKWIKSEFFKLTGHQLYNIKDLAFIKNHTAEIEFLFNQFSNNLAQFLSIFINRKKPFAIIIGGNVMSLDYFFLNQTKQNLYDLMGISIPIYKSEFGEIGPMIGSVVLAD